MPSKYWSELDAAPSPSEAAVALQERPGELVAVSIFGGYALGPRVSQKTLGTA